VLEKQGRQARVGSKQVCSLARVLGQGVEGWEGTLRCSELGEGKRCVAKKQRAHEEKGKAEGETGAGVKRSKARQARVDSKQACSITPVTGQGVEGREGAACRLEVLREKKKRKGTQQKNNCGRKATGRGSKDRPRGSACARSVSAQFCRKFYQKSLYTPDSVPARSATPAVRRFALPQHHLHTGSSPNQPREV
jgi:hypothetical protein